MGRQQMPLATGLTDGLLLLEAGAGTANAAADGPLQNVKRWMQELQFPENVSAFLTSLHSQWRAQLPYRHRRHGAASLAFAWWRQAQTVPASMCSHLVLVAHGVTLRDVFALRLEVASAEQPKK